jgi:hypothetical protein
MNYCTSEHIWLHAFDNPKIVLGTTPYVHKTILKEKLDKIEDE